ncbi:phosphotransferase family protein [Granulicoccus sp. GXG6511]|uniref:phosphotransferase family protein n=1 Tax=Granulicoccus sp. GXG6511 TaxID=3381351 RepID=UPI003D7C6DA6
MATFDQLDIQSMCASAEQVFHGFYNMNYLVRIAGRPRVLRIPIPGAHAMDMRFLDENEVLQLIEGLPGVNAPRLVAAGKQGKTRYSVHSFCAGEAIEQDYPESAVVPAWVVSRLASTMARIHQVKYPEQFARAMPWREDPADFYRHVHRYNADLITACWNELRETYDYLGMPMRLDHYVPDRSPEAHDSRFILAHADIHRKNVLIEQTEQEISVLDWELTLIAPVAYDVSIHFHKMRYQRSQEEAFLVDYCRATGADQDFLMAQVDLYRAIEEVKSVAVDAVRYLSVQPTISADANVSNARRYAGKLTRAYRRWGQDPDDVPVARIGEVFKAW